MCAAFHARWLAPAHTKKLMVSAWPNSAKDSSAVQMVAMVDEYFLRMAARAAAESVTCDVRADGKCDV
jgi:hypothetical protein